ncbi:MULTISPECIES: spermidine/putrescine ABC transporter substrate-binding protein [unclassified Curtobacterium]|uniref:spermidine/putrescine ABC transporter substrate-binding protein n=1 Tax=unclassified Curtobacterium TaxID=257496 RepID=UPI00226B7CA4|nr:MULTISPECIES: spermidine/putrescine ABC transporter substrate-binding protein [unclassified Curtobacterium]
MDGIDGRVRGAVDVWLRWLPRWQIGTARPRTRICRKCTGSPIASAAGFGPDVPHPVQHALIGRMSSIVEDAVDDYTAKNLPLLHRELERAAARKRHAGYQPAEGLSPEFQGLDVDPQPQDGSPFLFTLEGLAGTGASSDTVPREPLSDEAKAALRHEIELSDECARATGTAVCLALIDHRPRIAEAVERLVEPQIEALVSDMFRGLDGDGPRGGLF